MRRGSTAFQADITAHLSDGVTEGAENLFLQGWQHFSKLCTTHAFHLPPLFRSESSTSFQLIRSQARLAVWLERAGNGKGPGVVGTGHCVIGGPSGVGKSYILRGMALTVAALCSHAQPFTLD